MLTNQQIFRKYIIFSLFTKCLRAPNLVRGVGDKIIDERIASCWINKNYITKETVRVSVGTLLDATHFSQQT